MIVVYINDFKGMSLIELAHFLKSKGAYKAINLDGGGSTSMMIREPGIHSSIKDIPLKSFFLSTVKAKSVFLFVRAKAVL